MHSGEVRSQDARIRRKSGRSDTERGDRLLVLRRLLRKVHVQRAVLRELGNRRQSAARHGSYRVDRNTDADHFIGLQDVDTFRPLGDIGIGKAELGRRERLFDSPLQIAGVKQCEPDPGAVGRLSERRPHRILFPVGASSGLVMEIVKFTDQGEARQRHLGENCRGEIQIRVGVKLGSELVHGIAPLPKRAAAALGATAQRSVKCVRVGVGEPRKGEPGEPGRTRWAGLGQSDCGDQATLVAIDDHTASHRAIYPGRFAPELGHSLSIRRARAPTPASQSSALACSAGEWEMPRGLRTKIMAAGIPCEARMPAS